MKKYFLKSVGAITTLIVVYLILLLLFESYLKHEYIENCLSTGKMKDWCEKTWLELRMME